MTKAVAPPPIPKDSPVKTPDAGKNVAVLSKGVRKATGDPVAMGAGWAQAIHQKLVGEKKARSARKKSDRADAAKAQARATAPAPAATGPFVPRVQLAATVSSAHPINPLKIKPPKGSAMAPGKSIGPISVSPAALRERRLVARLPGQRYVALCGGKGGKPGPCAGDHHQAKPLQSVADLQAAKSLQVYGPKGNESVQIVDAAGAQHTYEKVANAKGSWDWQHQASGQLAPAQLANKLDRHAYVRTGAK